MQADSGVRLNELRVDGGMVRNELLMQFQSDILSCSVVRPAVIETTVLGAAYAAGLAVGFFADLGDLKRNWQAEKSWKPAMPEEQKEKLYAQWRRAVERSFGWAK
jgi:glycerol kinase